MEIALQREAEDDTHLAMWRVAGAEAGRRGHGWWDGSREGFPSLEWSVLRESPSVWQTKHPVG